jgi:GMP synthase (glutamine-hydrolysing)
VTEVSPRALIVQNERHCPPGLAYEATVRSGFSCEFAPAWERDVRAIDLRSYDGVMVLGGYMAADDFDEYPYLRDVIDLIRRSVDDEVPLLGVCLGAQQAARAIGGDSFTGVNGKELGWKTPQLTDAGKRDPILSVVDENTPVVQWHGDTFELPADAELLASTPQYANQAFRYGTVHGVQFHPEVDETILRSWHVLQMQIAPDATPPLHDLLEDVQQRTQRASRVIDAFWKGVLEQ